MVVLWAALNHREAQNQTAIVLSKDCHLFESNFPSIGEIKDRSDQL